MKTIRSFVTVFLIFALGMTGYKKVMGNINAYGEIEATENESILFNPIISESTNNQEEKTVLNFTLIDTNETVSVCIGKEDQSYIVCRIGKIGKSFQEYPDKRENTWDYYNYSYYSRGGGNENEGMDLNCLTYEDNDIWFEIHDDYVAQDDKEYLLIKTINKKTGEETIQEGDSESREGSLVNLRDNDDIEIIPYGS